MARGFWCMCLAFMLVVMPIAPAMAYDSALDASLSIYEVMEYLHQLQISQPDVDHLAEGAITGMLERLNDPYAEYLTEDMMAAYENELNGNYVGVGITLLEGEEYPLIADVLPDSPASQVDLQRGDLLLKVNGEDVKSMSLDQLSAKLQGPTGTQLTLGIRRGTVEMDVPLSLDVLSFPTVIGGEIFDDVGYIEILTFGEKTAQEFTTELDALLTQKVQGLILDLRNTPGGYLQPAVDIAGNFLPNDSLVLTAVAGNGQREEYRTQKTPRWHGGKVVVLMNAYTASASEVLAAALRDHDVGILLGETSYGKGVLQDVIPLEYGGALKITTAQYATPRGDFIDGKGLMPDEWVAIEELQLVKAKDIIQGPAKNRVVFSQDSNEVVVNDVTMNMQEIPFQHADVLYVPLRFAFEALGYAVTWDEAKQHIEVKGHGHTYEFLLESGTAFYDGTKVILQHALLAKDTVTYLPVNIKIPGISIQEKKGKVELIQTNA